MSRGHLNSWASEAMLILFMDKKTSISTIPLIMLLLAEKQALCLTCTYCQHMRAAKASCGLESSQTSRALCKYAIMVTALTYSGKSVL